MLTLPVGKAFCLEDALAFAAASTGRRAAAATAAATGQRAFAFDAEAHVAEINSHMVHLREQVRFDAEIVAFFLSLGVGIFRLIQSQCQARPASASGGKKNANAAGGVVRKVCVQLFFRVVGYSNHNGTSKRYFLYQVRAVRRFVNEIPSEKGKLFLFRKGGAAENAMRVKRFAACAESFFFSCAGKGQCRCRHGINPLEWKHVCRISRPAALFYGGRRRVCAMPGRTGGTMPETNALQPVEVMNAAEMSAALDKLADALLARHGSCREFALVGIQRRGVVIAEALCERMEKKLGASVDSGSLDITLYRDDWTTKSVKPWVGETRIRFDVDGKALVLVDDVLFTGRTIRAALEALVDFGRPSKVELLVLVDRGHRELPIHADYVGLTLETTREEHVDVLVASIDGEDGVRCMRKA